MSAPTPDPLEIRGDIPPIPENPLSGELEALAQALEDAGIDLTTLLEGPKMAQNPTEEGSR